MRWLQLAVTTLACSLSPASLLEELRTSIECVESAQVGLEVRDMMYVLILGRRLIRIKLNTCFLEEPCHEHLQW